MDVQKRKSFEHLGTKQKKRRSAGLSDYSYEELSFALLTKLKSDGDDALALVIEHLMTYKEKAEDVKSYLFNKKQEAVMEENEALALTISLDLSKWKYLTLRGALNTVRFPSYQKLLDAKKRCYPNSEDIEITEHGAKINLQALLNLTVKRIFKVVGEDLDTSSNDLKLICKWGFDGSSSQSNYKMKSEEGFDDSSVFMTSLVPLKLESKEKTVWENLRPSSTFYCRPVQFQFAKESTDYVKNEGMKLKEDIKNLTPISIGRYEITYELHMTMIDGKVATIITDTASAATCSLCKAKPSEMNDLEKIYSRPVQKENYQYGLSTLHMWIRSMECILHISYNLDFKMWCARGENKNLKQARKKMIQQEFKQEMGLLVDIVKQGFGTTNDGNTARKFFREFETTAKITKIDEDLIKHFAVILQVITSGKAVDAEKMQLYCRETAELFVNLYPWYMMPASIHKLLIHGPEICKHFSCLPIGILSEEAAEARNKDFRNTRERHTRKIGRIQNNEDILHNLLISSDPYISHIRPKYNKFYIRNLLPEAIAMILPKEVEDEEQMMEDEYAENVCDPLLI